MLAVSWVQKQLLLRRRVMQWLIACVFIITGIVAYFPIVFIRKTNKMLSTLERIEANTRAAQGSSSAAAR